MAEANQKFSAEQAATVRACVAKLVSSPVFAQSKRLQRLIEYLAQQTLAGRGDLLKGYTIGLEVFDRGADFDPGADPIVRVEAGRLRAKLLEYYSGEGSSDPMRIELPKGSYAVRVTAQDGAAPEHAAAAIAAPADKPSLAVLPFTNMSSDSEQEYFADGITEDLITEMSKLSGLFVIARHSAFVYKGVTKKVQEIGKELGVRYLVEGSVRRADGKVRISAQLIDADSGRHIWAEHYDRHLKDIFAVQDDVTRRIVDTLRVALSPLESQRIGHEGTASIEAHDMLLRGLERFWRYAPQATAEALTFFEKAVALDPDYALAHAWVARTLVFQWAMRWAEGDNLDRALEHAMAAVRLDDRLPFAHFALGWVRLWRRNGEEAVAEGRRAVALDPNSADAHLFLSLSLSATGHGTEALAYITGAMRLSPRPSAFYEFALAQAYYVLGRYDEAIAALKRGIALSAEFPPSHVYLAAIYSELGRMDEARAEGEKAFAALGSRQVPILNDMMLEQNINRRFFGSLKRIGLA